MTIVESQPDRAQRTGHVLIGAQRGRCCRAQLLQQCWSRNGSRTRAVPTAITPAMPYATTTNQRAQPPTEPPAGLDERQVHEERDDERDSDHRHAASERRRALPADPVVGQPRDADQRRQRAGRRVRARTMRVIAPGCEQAEPGGEVGGGRRRRSPGVGGHVGRSSPGDGRRSNTDDAASTRTENRPRSPGAEAAPSTQGSCAEGPRRNRGQPLSAPRRSACLPRWRATAVLPTFDHMVDERESQMNRTRKRAVGTRRAGGHRRRLQRGRLDDEGAAATARR